jgi:hypothetical protein
MAPHALSSGRLRLSRLWGFGRANPSVSAHHPQPVDSLPLSALWHGLQLVHRHGLSATSALKDAQTETPEMFQDAGKKVNRTVTRWIPRRAAPTSGGAKPPTPSVCALMSSA